MKTFKDLVFRNTGIGTIQARLAFNNEFQISVIAGKFAYSTPREDNNNPDFFEEFEVAIFAPNGDFATQDLFQDAGDDVMGWQSRADINTIMMVIQSQ